MTTTAPPLPPAPAEAATDPPAVDVPHRALRQAAVTALVAALITAWLFRHILAHPTSARVAGNAGDTALYSWWIQHGASAVLHGPRALLFTRSLNAPFGVNAMWNTSMVLPSVILAPLTELAGPLATFNLLLLSSPVLTAAVAHVLLRRLVGRDAAARVGALLWAFCPALLAADQGHLSLVFTPLVPAILLAAHESATGNRPRRAGVTLGLLLAAQLLTGEEILFQTGLVLALAAVVLAVTRPVAVNLAWVRRVAPATAFAAAAFLVVSAYPLIIQFGGPLAEHGSPFLTSYYVADATGLVTPSSRLLLSTAGQSQFARSFSGGAPEYMFYLGYPAIVLAVVAAYRLRRSWAARVLAVMVVAAGLASLGGDLLINGVRPGVHLPWRLVASLPLAENALPDRFAILTDLAVAGLAALLVDHLLSHSGGARRVVGWTLVAATAATWAPHSFDIERTSPTPAFFTHALPTDVHHKTVLLLPYPGPSRPTPMLWQAAAHDDFSAPGGYFIGPADGGQAYVSGPGPLATGKLLDGVATSGQVPAIDAAVIAQFQTDVRTWGAKTIVLGPDPQDAALTRAVIALTGLPPEQDDGVLIWHLATATTG